MTTKQIISELKKYSKKENIEGMKRFGIRPNNKLLGVNIPIVRKMGKKVGHNHVLALELWQSGIHEARILASIIDEPELVTAQQLEQWAGDIKSWDICDQACSNLFCRTKVARKRMSAMIRDDREFVRRVGFVVLTALAVHDKAMADSEFAKFFSYFKKYSTDERVYVKKAISWAMREIGKRRSRQMHQKIMALAEELKQKPSKSAKWIASDVIRELSNPKFLRFD